MFSSFLSFQCSPFCFCSSFLSIFTKKQIPGPFGPDRGTLQLRHPEEDQGERSAGRKRKRARAREKKKHQETQSRIFNTHPSPFSFSLSLSLSLSLSPNKKYPDLPREGHLHVREERAAPHRYARREGREESRGKKSRGKPLLFVLIPGAHVFPLSPPLFFQYHFKKKKKAALMADVYDEHKDVDGFLYMTFSGENTFG